MERAVNRVLDRVDAFTAGSAKLVGVPLAPNVAVCDKQLALSPSWRIASLFLAFYALEDPAWDFDRVPTGARGQYGDKRLSEELTRRHVTLHNAVTAFAENVGWKGDLDAVRLSTRKKAATFVSVLQQANPSERERIADYIAWRFAESKREVAPLPPVGDDVLTFARAKQLLWALLALPSEGHVQQFLLAALLRIHRRRYGFTIETHHPHAADRYDATAGDIEEFNGGQLVRAYEVTVRPDWKNRLSNFRDKMDRHHLAKYVIIAAQVNTDDDLAEPARLITFLEPIGRDIAVVDIRDVAVVMAAELSASELREAVNLTNEFLRTPALCGRPDVVDAYTQTVGAWLALASNAEWTESSENS